jgi:hypothetical protein
LPPLITIERFFPIRAAAPTNDVILILKLINLKADDSRELYKFSSIVDNIFGVNLL